MDEIETYLEEHQQLKAMMAELDRLVAADSPPDSLSFLRFRHNFGLRLTEHLNHEDWLIYPRLRASHLPELRAVADRHAAGMDAISTAFSGHRAYWTSEKIAAEWHRYRRATTALLAALHHRIELEEAELYPLVARVTCH